MNAHNNQKVAEIVAQFKKMDAAANDGCGLCYELYIDRFSNAANRFINLLSGEDLEIARAIADDFDILSPDEIQSARDEAKRIGLCQHFFVPDECPCGCGDLTESREEMDSTLDESDIDQEISRTNVYVDCPHEIPMLLCAESMRLIKAHARAKAYELSLATMKALRKARDSYPVTWEWTRSAYRHAIGLLLDLQEQIENNCETISLTRIVHEADKADMLAWKKATSLYRNISDILRQGHVLVDEKLIVR
jgi:hypothetical protein